MGGEVFLTFFVSGRPPLLLFHFIARGPLPRDLLPSRCAHFVLVHAQQDPDPAITSHGRGRRKHKLGARGGRRAHQVDSAWRWNSARRAAAINPGAPFPPRTFSMSI